MGSDACNRIGGQDFTEKEMVILENSTHKGYMEEHELLISAFRRFMD